MAYRKANLVLGGITLDFPTRHLIEAQSLGAMTDRSILINRAPVLTLWATRREE
jgi:phosphoglycerate dehydrogenase-like enzyme